MLRKEKRRSSKKREEEEVNSSQKTTSIVLMGSINEETTQLKIIEQIQFKTVICVAAGHHHFLCLTDTGNIFCYGQGIDGQLGLGEETKTVSALTPIPYFDDKFIVNISSNYCQSAAISGEGKLYTWGTSHSTNFTPQYQQILENKRVTKCSLGLQHSVALVWESKEYSIYCWGSGSYGQLGLQDFSSKNEPTLVPSIQHKKISSVSCGSKHSAAIIGGELFVWGALTGEKNPTPTLIEFKDEVISDICSGDKNLFAISQTGKIFSLGEGDLGYEHDHSSTPKQIEVLKSNVVKQIAAGPNHVLCIVEPKKNDAISEIYVWGETKYGKIGIQKTGNDNNNNNQTPSHLFTPSLSSELFGSQVIQLSCGSSFTVVLRIVPVVDGTGDEHVFERTQINFPMRCICCNRFIWGIRSTWKCILCGCMCHGKCRYSNLPKCEGGSLDSWTNDVLSDYITSELKDEVEKVAQIWSRAQSDFAIDFVRNLNHTYEVQSLPITQSNKSSPNAPRIPASEEERLKQILEIKSSIHHHKQQIRELKEILHQLENQKFDYYNNQNINYNQSNNLLSLSNSGSIVLSGSPLSSSPISLTNTPFVTNNTVNNLNINNIANSSITNNYNNNMHNNNINIINNQSNQPNSNYLINSNSNNNNIGGGGNNNNIIFNQNSNLLAVKKSSPSTSRPLSEMKRDTQSLSRNITIDKLWEIDPAEVTIDRQLGEGASAQVYLGHYRGQEVAIKVMKNKANEKQLADFECEFAIMREMKSKYNVFFYGACLNPNLCLLMEHCERGSLYQLFNDTSQKYTWSKALKIAVEICKGVSCLHSWEPQIIHRDLKSHNLLVDWNWNIKIGDFGLARLNDSLNKNPSLGKLRGTYSYCAPEIYYGKPFTEKSDIYSIGIILWELVVRVITGKYERPYSEFTDLQYDFQIIVHTARGMRCTIPPKTPEPLVRIIKSCWDPDPERRPTASALTSDFLNLLGKFRLNKDIWNST